MHVWGKWKCLPEVSIISLGALVHLHSSGCLPQQTLSCQGVERKWPFSPPLHSWYLIGVEHTRLQGPIPGDPGGRGGLRDRA